MVFPLFPLILGGLALGQEYQDRRRAGQRDLLQQGVQEALGTAPGLFEAELFPGEQPIEGLRTEGTGLLADPTNQANQLQFATSLMGLPGGRQIGANLIAQSLGFGQQNIAQQNLFKQQDRAQQNQFDFKAEQNELDRRQRYQIAQDRLNQQQNLARQKQSGQNLGSIKAGYERIQTPQGTFDRPLPGAPEYVKAVDEIENLNQSVLAMDELRTSVQTQGTEMFGSEAGKQGILYENAVALIGEAFNKGVLQEGEREAIESRLTDPNSITGQLTSTERILAEYDEVMKLLQRKLKTTNQKYALYGIGSQLANTTPAQQRELQAQQQREQQAAALGLTITPQPIPAPESRFTQVAGRVGRRAVRQALPGGGLLNFIEDLQEAR